jgi:hypothetical protein
MAGEVYSPPLQKALQASYTQPGVMMSAIGTAALIKTARFPAKQKGL